MSGPLLIVLLTALTGAVCLLAIWKGGPGERWTAVLILVVMALQRLARSAAPESLHPTIALAGDGIPALVLLVLTVRYASPWLGAIMLFYAGQFALHSFYIVTLRPMDLLHFAVNNFNVMGIHVALVLGTVTAWRRRIRRQRATAAG